MAVGPFLDYMMLNGLRIKHLSILININFINMTETAEEKIKIEKSESCNEKEKV